MVAMTMTMTMTVTITMTKAKVLHVPVPMFNLMLSFTRAITVAARRTTSVSMLFLLLVFFHPMTGHAPQNCTSEGTRSCPKGATQRTSS